MPGRITRLDMGLFRTKDALDEADVKRGVRLFTLDGMASSSMVTLQGGPFLAAFAIALGAGNYEIGLLATISFLSQFMQVPGLFLVKSLARRRAIVVLAAGLSRLVWIPIALIPLLFLDRGMTFLVQWIFLAALVGALAGPAWNSWIRDMIPQERMGRVVSLRMGMSTAIAMGLTILGGWFIGWWQESLPDWQLHAYSILFAGGLAAGLLGLLAISRMPEARLVPATDVAFLPLLAAPLKDSNFRRLLAFVGTWSFAVNLAGPFFIIYMMRNLEITIFLVTVLTVTAQASNLLFLRIWGRLADRFSNKSVLAVSGPLFLIAILAWTFTAMPEVHPWTLPMLFGIQVLGGMSTAGVSLAAGNIALKLSPQGMAHAYMTVHGLVAAVAGACAPIIGGVLADVFATRGFSVSFNWSEPAREVSFYALNLRALDFLFVLAFLAGLYSLKRLAAVREEGEADPADVRAQLVDEVAAPFRAVATMPGVRQLVVTPISAVSRFASGVVGAGKPGRTVEAPAESH